MQDSLTSHSSANTIRMTLANEKVNGVIILEGKHDRKLIENFINTPAVSLVNVSGGKPRILEVAKIISDDKASATVRFVLDSDFDSFPKYPAESDMECVIFSETHDCFTDYLHANPETLTKVANILLDDPMQYLEEILEKSTNIAKKLAVMRVLNQVNEFGMNFHSFRFESLRRMGVDPQIDEMLDCFRVITDSCKERIKKDFSSIESKMAALEFNLVNDHDLLKALANGISSHRNRGISEDYIRNMVQATTTYETLNRVFWLSELKKWCASLSVPLWKNG